MPAGCILVNGCDVISISDKLYVSVVFVVVVVCFLFFFVFVFFYFSSLKRSSYK